MLEEWWESCAHRVGSTGSRSLIGRTLGRFFCGMIMGTALGLDADYISTHANVVADYISRLKRSSDGQYDHSKLLTDHPLLCSCRTFQPSKSLLTMLWDIMLNSASPDPLIIRQLKPETLGSFIFLPTSTNTNQPINILTILLQSSTISFPGMFSCCSWALAACLDT